MKTKLLLAALALPIVFSACGQDEFENGQNAPTTIPDNAIQGLTLNVNKNAETDGVSTRGEWNDDQAYINFTKDDKISLYWLGLDDGATPPVSFEAAALRDELNGKFNSIFRTEDGSIFSSESLVFEGGNIAVYPGDVTFYKEGTLYVNVPQNQDKKTLENIPYISNQLWIKERVGQDEQLPGYYGNSELDCPVKLAANVVKLTLNLSNIPQGYDFTVESVELVGDASTFTTKSAITTRNKKPNYKGEVPVGITTEETIVAETWTKADVSSKVSKLTTTNVVMSENGQSAVAQFVVLPTDVASLTIGKVIVRTNCGTITLSSDDAEPVKIMKGETEITINDAIKSFVASQTSGDDDSKFYNESIGKRFQRSIDVDVRKAKLNDSYVYDAAGIIRYVNLYKDLPSVEDPVNLILASKDPLVTTFKGFTKEAADKLLSNTKFHLQKGSMSAIEIIGGGEVFDISNAPAIPLQLGNATWTMEDNFEFASDLEGIVNNGTLTIKGSATTEIEEAITNNGTINLGSSLVKVGSAEFKTNATSIINIDANQELQFTAANTDGDLKGTINVMGNTSILSTTASVYNNGTINNYGIIAGNASNGWDNKGTVNIKDDSSITYLAKNAGPGVVNLKSRDNEVKVQSNVGKIVYNWNDGENYVENANDKFTYVVFDENTPKLTIQTVLTTTPITSMEFRGLCTVTAKNKTINNLIIGSGADFRFTTGNTLNVTNLTNNGLITIGGTITYKTNFTNNGRVLTTGSGAIVKK